MGVTVFLDVFYALLLSALFRGVTDDQAGTCVSSARCVIRHLPLTACRTLAASSATL